MPAKKWNDEKIREALESEVERLGRLPKYGEIKAKGLSGALQKRGGFKRWAPLVGAKLNRTILTPVEIESELRKVTDRLGRMPTFEEMGNSLGAKVLRIRPSREWAKRLGVPLKDSDTKRGQDSEDEEEAFLKNLGFVVERQTTKAPFDMLVNGHRVDVKSATWTDYWDVRGYIFAGLKNGQDADFFLLVCRREDGAKTRFLVPAESVHVQTITITEKTLFGHGKYSPFHEAFDLIR